MSAPEANIDATIEMAARCRAKDEARFPALKGVKTHPFLDVIPLMTDDEFRRFNWSLKNHGLLDPIVMADGCIIDGRCRYIGCKAVGVEPRFKEFKFDGDPADKDEAIQSYVWSANFLRQSLNASQRCVLDALVEVHLPGYYPEDWVSDEARLVARYDDIAKSVTHGGAGLADAYNAAIERERVTAQAEENHRRLVQLRAEDPFAAALVDEGTLTLDQGLARAEEAAAAPLLAEHVQSIRGIGRRMIADALEIGRRLAECRRLVRRDWIGWLDRELGLSDRAALNFMRIYQLAQDRSENFADLSLPMSGLYLLAQPSTPELVRDEVFQRAEGGEAISFADIKREVSGERPAGDRLDRLARVASQLAEERPDDPLVQQLQALVAKMADEGAP